MVSTMHGPGRSCGKAVATRWRATGGAGHKCHNERADWPIGQSRGRAVGVLPQSPFSVVGCGCGCNRHLGRGVVCSGGRRFEWCVHSAHAGFSGGRFERNDYELAGSHLEYSAAPPCVRRWRFPTTTTVVSGTVARFVVGCGLSVEKGPVLSSGLGLAENNPTLLTRRD
jgi:hypothetical protein